MKHFLWFTCIIAEYDSRLITAFVKKGYGVGAAAAAGQIIAGEKNRSGVVIGLVIEKSKATAQSIADDLMEIVKEEGMYYHSYVISEMSNDSVWNSSNIEMPSYAPSLTKANDDDNKLN